MCVITVKLETMLASSLSFLHSCGFPSSSSSSSSLSTTSQPKLKPFMVEAKVRTRREDRTARHTRIRKKVHSLTHFPQFQFSLSLKVKPFLFLFFSFVRLKGHPRGPGCRFSDPTSTSLCR